MNKLNTLITFFIDNLKIEKLKNNILKKYYNIDIDLNYYNILNKDEITIKYIQNYMETILENKTSVGAVFTPENIVNSILNKTVRKFYNPKICDLSCGNGAFLTLSAIDIFNNTNQSIISIIENNIYGVDILEENIENCKIILSLLALKFREDKENINFNLKCTDGLSKNLFPNEYFDCIIGNPPYIQTKNMDKLYINKIKENYKSITSGQSNIFYCFLEQCIGNYLKTNGISGVIIPNNIATLICAKSIRKILVNKINHIKEVIDFKDELVFSNAKIYTAIYILTKAHNNSITYNNIEVDYQNLSYNQWNFLSNKDFENINKIESFDLRLNIKGGISTNRDELYFIYNLNLYDNKYYYKEFNGKTYEIEKDIVLDLIKIGGYKKLKIIYPYIFKNEREFEQKYPKTYKYFTDIKSILIERNMQTNKWYEYARKQGLNFYNYKLLYASYNKTPNFIINTNYNLLYTNGYSIILNSEEELNIYNKLLNSIIMEYYMKLTSHFIDNGYLCYQKKIVEKFSIPYFSNEEKNFILSENDKNILNKFFIKKYNLDL